MIKDCYFDCLFWCGLVIDVLLITKNFQNSLPLGRGNGMMISWEGREGQKTYLFKEGFDAPPQIASYSPTHETPHQSPAFNCHVPTGITRLGKVSSKKWLQNSLTGIRTEDHRVCSPSPYPFGHSPSMIFSFNMG